jgi:hypothetical protein
VCWDLIPVTFGAGAAEKVVIVEAMTSFCFFHLLAFELAMSITMSPSIAVTLMHPFLSISLEPGLSVCVEGTWFREILCVEEGWQRIGEQVDV